MNSSTLEISFITLQILDKILTYIGIEQGLSEMNPLVLLPYTLFSQYHALLITLFIGVGWSLIIIMNAQEHKYYHRILGFMLVTLSLVTINNMWWIFTL